MTRQTSLETRPSLMAALCYSLGWISGIFFLIVKRDNQAIRFHAWQSTIFFGLLTFLGTVAYFVTAISFLEVGIAVAAVVTGRILIYLAYTGQLYSLPLIGQMAERLARLKGINSPETTIPVADNQPHGKTA